MKEKLCYVGYDIAAEQKLAQETTFLVVKYSSLTDPSKAAPVDCLTHFKDPTSQPSKTFQE